MRDLTRRRFLRTGLGISTSIALATPLLAACGGAPGGVSQPVSTPIPPAPQPPAPAAAPKQAVATPVSATATSQASIPTPTVAAKATTAPAPKTTGAGQKDTLVFLVPNFAPVSWPYPRGAAVGGISLYWSVWEGLYMTDNSDSVQIVPALATSFKALDDGVTFEFELRQDVKFHNGDRMTAEDVAWSLNTFKLGTYAWYSRSFGSAEAVGEFRVRVRNKQPDYTIVNNMAWQGWILPKRYWDSVGGEEGFAKAPIGTGPYRLVKFVPDDYYEMEVFSDHWRKEQPFFKKIVVRWIPEPATQLAMLKSGEADVLWGSAPRLYEAARRETGLKGVAVAGGRITAYPMNQAQVMHWKNDDPRVKPFADKRVRQAANYAVNRQEMVEKLWLGHVTPVPAAIATTVLRPAPDMKPYPFDPDRARALLKEAGYPNGFETLMYGVATGGYVINQDMDQTIANYLQQVGIKVNLQLLEGGVLQQKTQDLAKDVNPIYQIRRGATVRHPSTVGLDISCPQSDKDRPSWFCHDDIERRLVEGRAIGDPAKLQTHYQQLDRDIREEAPWIFLWEDPDYFLMREDIDWKIVGGTNYRYNLWTARRK